MLEQLKIFQFVLATTGIAQILSTTKLLQAMMLDIENASSASVIA